MAEKLAGAGPCRPASALPSALCAQADPGNTAPSEHLFRTPKQHFPLCRSLKRPLSAWAEEPAGGGPRRPASALPSTRCAPAEPGDTVDATSSEHLFWTPPKDWMLACMDRGKPLPKKAYSFSGEVQGVQLSANQLHDCVFGLPTPVAASAYAQGQASGQDSVLIQWRLARCSTACKPVRH